ncbi:MAG: RIP metalloprotease RseP [Rhodobacteraceae bacterium]|nr:RIP metalloprotease RseP [Paracoccaceae bacterium]
MDLFGLIPHFGNLAYTLGAFVVALSIIVTVHEFGHYIVARWCGIHAEVFSLGFGPQLFSRRDRRGTLWQIAALPLGGYVKFLGDSDAASGPDAAALGQMDPATLRKTMHAAPLWARSATVAAGPLFNFALSILVFAGVAMVQGQAVVPLTVHELRPMPGSEQTLKSGDEILAIDGKSVPSFDRFDEFLSELPQTARLDYRVRRDGREIDVQAPYPYPPLVAGVTPQSPAIAAGLERNDVILAANGHELATFEDLRTAVHDANGAPLDLAVWRHGETFERSLTPREMDIPDGNGGFEKRYLIGVTGGLFFIPATSTLGPADALGFGAGQTVLIIRESLSGLYHMVTGAISSCNLSGPIGIAETSGEAASQGAVSFLWFIAVLSAAVGLLNLFPVPVLDGGHLVFHAWEAMTGAPPSDGALRALMTGGLAMIAALMVFALSNDLFCP